MSISRNAHSSNSFPFLAAILAVMTVTCAGCDQFKGDKNANGSAQGGERAFEMCEVLPDAPAPSSAGTLSAAPIQNNGGYTVTLSRRGAERLRDALAPGIRMEVVAQAVEVTLSSAATAATGGVIPKPIIDVVVMLIVEAAKNNIEAFRKELAANIGSRGATISFKKIKQMVMIRDFSGPGKHAVTSWDKFTYEIKAIN